MNHITKTLAYSVSVLFFGSSCASRELGSDFSSIGSPYGQIEGFVRQSGERVCVHKFEAQKGYKVSDPSGPTRVDCGTNVRWVAREDLTYSSNAMGKWLQEIRPGGVIKLNMQYATNQIFPMGNGAHRINEPLYGQGRCFVHPRLVSMLNAADSALRSRNPNLRLMLLDCYRPNYVSQRMWDLVRDPEWVAADGKSSHNRGGAVDLTLATVEGLEALAVDMGGEFDEFSSVSHYRAEGISPESREYRRILREAMQGAGFRPYDSEWWHFSADGHAEFLDLPL